MADESGNESGAEFRQKFEATQAEARAAKEALANVFAEQHGLDPQALMEFKPNEIATKAQELAETQKAQQDQLLRQALEARGLSGDDLEEALGKLAKTEKTSEGKPAVNPFASTGQLPANPVGSTPDRNVRGRSRIAAALATNKN